MDKPSKKREWLTGWVKHEGPSLPYEEVERQLAAWAEEIVQERQRAFRAFMERVLGQVSLDEKAAHRERVAWLLFKIRAIFPKLPLDG